MARPRKYTPAMLDKVLLSAADGATWDAIARNCGIDVATAKRWSTEGEATFEPAFCAAVTLAKDAADNAMLASLFHLGIGYDFKEQVVVPGKGLRTATKRKHGETAAAKSWLANRIGWRGETQRVETEDPMLAIIAAMMGSSDGVPAVPEAD